MTQTWPSFWNNDLGFGLKDSVHHWLRESHRGVSPQPAVVTPPKPEEPGDLGAADSMRSQWDHLRLGEVDCCGTLYGKEKGGTVVRLLDSAVRLWSSACW